MKIESNLLFNEPIHLEKPFSWVEHIPLAFFLVETIRPKILVELGTHSGNSYFAFCQAVKDLSITTKCYAVDTWEGDEHAGYYGSEVFQRVKRINKEDFSHFSNLQRMTFDEAVHYHIDKSIDVLHIDGLHTYDAVKHDFKTWLPKISNKGVVLMHDTNVKERNFGVGKFYEELKEKYPSFEFNHGNGLGVLCIGENVNTEFLKFIETAKINSRIQQIFAHLGKKIIHKKEKEELHNELATLKNEKTKVIEEIDKREKEINNFKNIITEKDKKLNEFNEKLVKLNKAITKKDGEITELQQNIAHIKKVVYHKETELEKLQDKFNLNIINNQNKEDKLYKDKEILQETIKNKDEEIELLKHNIVQLKKTISLKKNELELLDDQLSKKLNESTKKIEELNDVKEKLTHKLSDKEGAINELIKNVAQIKTKYNELEKINENNQRYLAKKEGVIYSLTSKTSQLEIKYKEKENEAEKQIKNLIKLKKQDEKQSDIIEKLTKKLEGHNNEISHNYDTIQELENQIDNNFKEISSLKELSNDYNKRSAELNQELLDKINIIANLEDELNVRNSQIEDFKKQNEKNLQKISEKEKIISENFKTIDRLELIEKEFLRINEEQKSRLIQLKTEIKKRDEEIQHITSSFSWKITLPLRCFGSIKRFLASDIFTPLRLLWFTFTFQKAKLKKELHCFKYRSKIADSGFFNIDWYLKEYPDVAKTKTDPIKHYIRRGADECRNPSPDFCTKDYLSYHKDVERKGINPLIHYVLIGRYENRRISGLNVNTDSNIKQKVESEKSEKLKQEVLFNDLENKVKRKYPDRKANVEHCFLEKVKRIKEKKKEFYDQVRATVIMPTYNRSFSVSNAIESVIEQSHKNFELLIIDDGSTDNTKEVVEKYVFDNRIRYVPIKKSGVSAARSKGLDEASGDIIFYLDSDNGWETNFLETMIVFLLQGDLGAAFCGSKIFDNNNNIKFYRGDFFSWIRCFEQNYVDMNCFCHKRKLSKDHRFDKTLRRLVDWDFILRVTADIPTSYAPFYGVNYYDGDKGERITHVEYQGEELQKIEKIIRKKHGAINSKIQDNPELRPTWEKVISKGNIEHNNFKKISIKLRNTNDKKLGCKTKKSFIPHNPILSFFEKCNDDFIEELPGKVFKLANKELSENKLGVSVIAIINSENNSNIYNSIRSVLSQNYKPKEILIIYNKYDKLIIDTVKEKFSKEINSGVLVLVGDAYDNQIAAVNAGLQKSSGDLVAYIDGNCKWHDNYLMIMSSIFSLTEEVSTAYTGIKCFNDYKKDEVYHAKEFQRKELLNENFIDLNVFMHRRFIYDFCGGFDEKLNMGSDWDLIIRYTRCYTPAFIPWIGAEMVVNKLSEQSIFYVKNKDIGVKCIKSKHSLEMIKYGIKSLKLAYVLWDWPALSQTFVLNEIRWLVEKGFDLKVYYKVEADMAAELDFQVQDYKVIDHKHLSDLLIKHNRTLCHGYFAYPATTLLVYPACKATEIPFTFIAHAVDLFHEKNIERNLVSEMVKHPQCIKIFVPGDYHRFFLEKKGVPADKISYNLQAVDLMPFENIEPAYKKLHNKEKFRGAFIGRFVEKKGIEVLIQAANLLKKEPVEFDIYGYGPLENQCIQKTKEMDINNIKFHGPLKGSEALTSAVENSDFIVVPSVIAENGDREGFPTIIFEALAAGRPVVASAVSAVPDHLRDMIEIIFAEPKNPQSLANAIRKCINMDAQRCEVMINNAKNFLKKNVGTSITMQNYLDIWNDFNLDIFLVTYNNNKYEDRVETFEIIYRILKYTTTPFVLTIIDNNSDSDFREELLNLIKNKPNIKLVLKQGNVKCASASNIAINLGESKYAIYLCSKEAFIGKHGWEKKFIQHMRENPMNAIAGYKTHLPKYTLGSEIKKHPEFIKFRNKEFALNNPEKPFSHVQGGVFIVNREAFINHGGYSSKIPQGNMDVEYSYYLESLGIQTGVIDDIVSITTKTLPGVETIIDNKTVVAHPLTKHTASYILDNRVNSHNTLCNICGESLNNIEKSLDPCDSINNSCTSCSSTAFGRLIYRKLAHDHRAHRNGKIVLLTKDKAIPKILGKRMFHVLFGGDNYKEAIKTIRNNKNELEIIILDTDIFKFNDVRDDEVRKIWQASFNSIKKGGMLLYADRNYNNSKSERIINNILSESQNIRYVKKSSIKIQSRTFLLDWRPLFALEF